MAKWSKTAALFMMLCFLSFPARAQTQSGKASTRPLLTDQEKRGEGLFLQRCALCHLPKVMTPAPAANPYKSFGPSLKGILPKDADSDQESFVRLFILKGTERMPGFQYSLKPSEIDDVITYLKTI